MNADAFIYSGVFLVEREVMFMKKKTLLLLLSISLCSLLIACSSSAPSDNIQAETQMDVGDASKISEPLYDHINNDDYYDMLTKYNDIFMEAMSIIPSNQVSTLIGNDASISEVVTEIDRVLSEIDISASKLQKYYDTFDQNRSEAPMQTKIMTMLSNAQSALAQYKMAMEDLKLYSISPEQEYMDNFTKYIQKSEQSIEDYNTVLREELSKLGKN